MLLSVFGQAKGYGIAIAVLLFAKGSAKDHGEAVILLIRRKIPNSKPACVPSPEVMAAGDRQAGDKFQGNDAGLYSIYLQH